MPIRVSSITEQVAAHLRDGLLAGRWRGTMPGRDRLADSLGVSLKSVQRALEMLANEGMLTPQGVGRRCRIELPNAKVRAAQRVAILDFEPVAETEGYMFEMQHLLAEAGHTAFFSKKSLTELGMNVKRIARFVEATDADAWVVSAGSYEVLEWFAELKKPAFALAGRRRGLPIAGIGPDKPPAYRQAVRTLVENGHRGIVLLTRRPRLPVPGASERAFLDELKVHGILPGPYHLPDLGEGVDGFHARLESLFQVTPPTALIVDEVLLFVATQQFLAGRGLRVPTDVSLVCTDSAPFFPWCRPSIAHIHWDSRPMVKRIVQWVTNVSRGKKDILQSSTPAVFVSGGTIGPAREP